MIDPIVTGPLRHQLERRRFMAALAGGLLTAPLAVEAQPANKVPRIGVLWGGPAEFAKPYLEAGRRALGELGYVEGRDFAVEYAFGERKPGAVDVLAPGLVQRKMDVIVAAGDPAIYAARRAGDINDPHRDGGGGRPGRGWPRSEPGPTRGQRHRHDVSFDGTRRETARNPQRDRSNGVSRGGPLESG